MTIKTNYFDETSYSSLDAIAPTAALLTNGVYNITAGRLFVTCTTPSSLAVNVALGSANVNGYFVNSDIATTVAISSNTSGYNRIDSIVVNVDVANKVSSIIAVQGIPSSSPVAPTLTSNQLLLANVTVGNNVSVLENNVISDKRVDVGLFNNNLQSLQTNGYKKLGGGLIRQWGKVTNTTSGTGTITLPTLFPNACLGVQATIQPSGYNAVTARIPTITTTTFTYETLNTSGSQVACGFLMWEAIGY